MALWTLVSTLGDGSNNTTNGHPDADWYGGTFIWVGEIENENLFVYTTCDIFQPKQDRLGNQWQEIDLNELEGFNSNDNESVECFQFTPKPRYEISLPQYNTNKKYIIQME